MAYSFNVFSGTLDQVGSSAVVFEGEVETFADLPEAVGDPAVGASYLVRTSTGVWLVNRRQAGIWIRKNNTGVRATDWEYGGDYPVNSVAGKTGNVTLTNSDISGLGTAATADLNAISDADLRIVGSTDSTKKVAIEVDTNVPANTTVTLTAPSASGTLALAGAAPASHTHGNITNDGLVGTTANLPLKTGTGGIVEAGAFGTTSGTFAAGDDSRITGAAQKSANLSDLASASTARTNLGLGTAATAATGDFAAASHNHAASAITSGVLDNARINFAAPSAIGALIPNTGLFTNLSVTSRLNLPSSGANANDIWVSNGQVRYQAGSLIASARTLLSAEDNLSSLDNTATARTNLGVGSSSAVTFGSIQATPIGSTTAAAITGTTGTFTTLSANNGTITASAPVLSLSQTWNNAATTFTGLQFDVTNTASATSSLVARFTIGSTNVFETDVRGFTTLRKVATSTDFVDIFTVRRGTTKVFGVRDDGATQAAGFSCSAGGDGASNMNSNGFGVRSSGSYSISSDGAAFNPDVFLRRDAAGIFAQYNAANPQAYRIYNTFTDANNHERGFMRWSSNVLQIGTEAGGTGSARNLELQAGGVTRLTCRSGGGVDIAGASSGVRISDYTIQGLGGGLDIRSASGSTGFNLDTGAITTLNCSLFDQRSGTTAQEYRLAATYTSATNYQRMTIKSVKQTLSALSGASATTTGTFIPDGAVVVGVTTRVATALTGAAGYTIGDGTDADRWGDITGTAIGTTSDNRDWTAGTIECFTAGGNITLTAKTSNFTAGAIEICVFYLAGEAD